MRSFIAFLATLGVATLVAATPASAQLGYLRFGGHVTGGAHFRGTPAHVYFTQGSDLVDRPDAAFSPGSHTIARLEFDYKGCTAVATNVTFTITAGQVTEIDPELSLVSCLIQVAPGTIYGGTGKVQLLVGNQVMFECVIAPSLTGGPPIYGPFDNCNRALGYGTAFRVRIIPHDAHSGIYAPGCAPETQEDASPKICPEEKADTNWTTGGNHIALAFEGFDIPEPPEPSADISIARVSTSIAGLGLVSTFRVTNHGPDAAVVEVVGGIREGGSHVGIAAGPCVFYACQQLLPASASLDFTLRFAPSFAHDAGGNVILPAADFGCAVVGVGIGASNAEDPDLTNNVAPCIGTDVTIAVMPGTSAPPNATVATGSGNVPMLQFILDPPSPITLDNITVTASGTGNEQVDVTAVKLYVDTNGNGVVDGSESAIASGTFPSNDGTVVLDVSPDYAVSGATSFLVTYDFNTSIAPRLAASLAMFALLPFGLVGKSRRKRWTAFLMLLLASITVASCGGDSGGPTGPDGGTATYKATLTGVTASGSAVASSLAGATITIDK